MQESHRPDRLTKSHHESSLPVLELAPDLTLADVERAVIMATLQRLRGNRTHAARALGIGIRTLQRKLKLYQLSDSIEDGSAPSKVRDQAEASILTAHF